MARTARSRVTLIATAACTATSMLVSPAKACDNHPQPTPQLVSAVQAHLARVGCYVGPIDGKWSGNLEGAKNTYNAIASEAIGLHDQAEMLATLDSSVGRVCP